MARNNIAIFIKQLDGFQRCPVRIMLFMFLNVLDVSQFLIESRLSRDIRLNISKLMLVRSFLVVNKFVAGIFFLIQNTQLGFMIN